MPTVYIAHDIGRSLNPTLVRGQVEGSELEKRVIDSCLQFFGGWGYMEEYPIARAYRDARVQTIYGGTTEIMKEIIGRSL